MNPKCPKCGAEALWAGQESYVSIADSEIGFTERLLTCVHNCGWSADTPAWFPWRGTAAKFTPHTRFTEPLSVNDTEPWDNGDT